MATIIRTDMIGNQSFLLFAAVLALLPAASGAEQEIYVTTGQDGVEVFSNLPRGVQIRQEGSAIAAKGRAVIISRQSAQPLGAVADDHSQGSEADASGKAFLLDD